MNIDARYQFPRDTIATILTSGLLGEQYVGFSVGGDEAVLKNGDTPDENSVGDRAGKHDRAIPVQQGRRRARSETPVGRRVEAIGGSLHNERNALEDYTPPAANALTATACLVGALTASGCASTNPKDPLEGFNRGVFAFNEVADKVVIKPVAQGYDKAVPLPGKVWCPTCSPI